jgi:radical SAM protein with 4Fe4S-binding SPASM domain
MLAHHAPAPALLAQLAVYGCAGGDLLIGAKPGGQLTACSFAAPPPALAGGARPRATDLGAYWAEPSAFAPFRDWRAARAPCSTCDYLPLCRGGCRVVAAHVTGDLSAPDPECPRVVDHAGASQRGAAARRLPVI